MKYSKEAVLPKGYQKYLLNVCKDTALYCLVRNYILGDSNLESILQLKVSLKQGVDLL